MIEKLYLALDLSSIIPLDSGDEAAEEGTVPTEDDASIASEPAPTVEAVSEQDEDNDW